MPPGREIHDLVGQRYGRLVVIEMAERRLGREVGWICQCDCGTVRTVRGSSLGRNTRSCGCLLRELATKSAPAPQAVRTGLADQPLYRVWKTMIRRCENPEDRNYPDYGGRGITVCDRWRTSLADFLADVGERPPDPPGWTSNRAYWSIDRIDNDGNYEPGNVRWATPAEQNRNQRPRRAAA